jgi:transcriptional regulator with XRE-family HTH domain
VVTVNIDIRATLDPMAQFGSLISEHRERLGLSSGRVAELVGRSPGTVRAWEKGRSHPDDPVVVSSLAAVLGIDERDLFVAAGLEPPRASAPFSLEQTLAAIAPSSRQSATEQVDMPESKDDASGRHARRLEDRKLNDRESAVDRLRTAIESVSGSVADSRRSRRRGGSARPNPILPEQQAPVAFGSSRKRPMAALSYMEDVEERWSYRIRSILTISGVGVLGLILLWAASELLGAFGDVWNALTAGL